MATASGFGYGEKVPVPARPEAERLAYAVIELLEANAAMVKAKEQAYRQSYYGQWISSDWFANEQEDFNRAADRLCDLVKDSMI